MRRAILDLEDPVPVVVPITDITAWASWLVDSKSQCVVGETIIPGADETLGVVLRTIFTGMDPSADLNQTAMYFATFLYDEVSDCLIKELNRYATWRDADQGHVWQVARHWDGEDIEKEKTELEKTYEALKAGTQYAQPTYNPNYITTPLWATCAVGCYSQGDCYSQGGITGGWQNTISGGGVTSPTFQYLQYPAPTPTMVMIDNETYCAYGDGTFALVVASATAGNSSRIGVKVRFLTYGEINIGNQFFRGNKRYIKGADGYAQQLDTGAVWNPMGSESLEMLHMIV